MCGIDSATSERHDWKFKMSELFIGINLIFFRTIVKLKSIFVMKNQ